MGDKLIHNKKNLKEEFVNELVPGELYHFIHNDRILYGTFKGKTPAWLFFDVEGKEVLAKPWTNVATTAEELEEIMGIVDRMEKDTKIPSQVPNRFTRVPNQHNKPIGESNELEQRAKKHKKKTGRKTRQKGFSWYGSLKPNAGDVEKGIEMFNAAQPDGGIGAVSPVNGNAMGESVEEAYYTQPDGSWNRDNSAELDAERKERESHKDASKRVKVIDSKDYNRYKTGTVGEVYTDRHGDEIYRVKLDDDTQDRYIPFKKDQLKFIGNENLEEAALKKYSYTGPIYYLGNKISTKSKLFTTAKSWDQARNNIIFRIANGDVPSHYDIADTELREISGTSISDMEQRDIQKCDICGYQLTDSGDCPVCDYGEEDLFESINTDSNLDAISQLNRME